MYELIDFLFSKRFYGSIIAALGVLFPFLFRDLVPDAYRLYAVIGVAISALTLSLRLLYSAVGRGYRVSRPPISAPLNT